MKMDMQPINSPILAGTSGHRGKHKVKEASSEPVDSFSPGENKPKPTGQVFDPNPVVTLKDPKLKDKEDAKDAVPEKAYFKVPLQGLENSGYLDGPYVSTKNTSERVKDDARQFILDRSQPGFEEVMVYHHIDSSQRYIQSLGFKNINNRQIAVDARGTTEDNSWYSLYDKTLTFGTGGVDDAEDADIILHEYGHSIQDNQVPGFGTGSEARAMGEGFGDYWGYSAFSSKSDGFDKGVVGNWDATAYSSENPPALRRVDSKLTYEDRTGEPYHDSEIWSGTLVDIFNALGKEVADKVVLESQFAYSRSAKFSEGAQAIIEADKKLFKGQHLEKLTEVFKNRKIEVKTDDSQPGAPAGPIYAVKGRPEDIASAYLRQSIFQSAADRGDLRPERTGKGLGADYVHFQQFYKNIPVEGAEATVIVEKGTNEPSLFRNASVSESLFKDKPFKAAFTEKDARRIAADHVKPSAVGKAGLVYYDQSGEGKDYALAWKIQVPSKETPGDWRLYVSAEDGKILASFNDRWIDKKK
jgi:hypothetical protein